MAVLLVGPKLCFLAPIGPKERRKWQVLPDSRKLQIIRAIAGRSKQDDPVLEAEQGLLSLGSVLTCRRQHSMRCPIFWLRPTEASRRLLSFLFPSVISAPLPPTVEWKQSALRINSCGFGLERNVHQCKRFTGLAMIYTKLVKLRLFDRKER